MKRKIAAAFLILGLLSSAEEVMAVEEAKYTVVERQGDLEIREYAPCVLAEVVVAAELEEAGDQAFSKLFRYISGDNRARGKIAMTAPVAQEAREKIAMTAPVGQERTPTGYAVSFMMPAGYTLETLPVPTDPAVKLRQVPARRMAAIRYSGSWNEAGFQKHKRELEGWMRAKGLEAAGEAVWARYNPPFMPWFLRRNEVLIPLGVAP